MRLMLAALVAMSIIAVTASVFAIWASVADAPWEDDAQERLSNHMRCDDALALRQKSFQFNAMEIFDQEAFRIWLTIADSEIGHYC